MFVETRVCFIVIFKIYLHVHVYVDKVDNYIHIHVRGLSGKFADTTNKTRNMYPRLKKFCINKYQLSSTTYT